MTTLFHVGDLVGRLAEHGWARVGDVRNDEDLLRVAGSLGEPIRLGNGSFIKRIRPMRKSQAPVGSLSQSHGRAAFPLHTDTAFWPVPARYLALRVVGDLRRTTTIYAFDDLVRALAPRERKYLPFAIWRVHSPLGQFYCSMWSQYGRTIGWRFDQQCMQPANKAAQAVNSAVKRVLKDASPLEFRWTNEDALVVANSVVLHGRGAAPEQIMS